MMGTFQERIKELEDTVGTGHLVGQVLVDQPYAQDQHETMFYGHPGGGQAKYLSEPLMANHPEYLRRLAGAVLDEGGALERAMIRNVEDLSGEVYKHAPFEFGDLKASGHPMVFDGDRRVYDRKPNVGRLNESDQVAKQELRNIGFGHNSWENTES